MEETREALFGRETFDDGIEDGVEIRDGYGEVAKARLGAVELVHFAFGAEEGRFGVAEQATEMIARADDGRRRG